MVLWMHITLFSGCLVFLTGIFNVQAWTYHYNIDSNMDWTEARQWCQTHFTDMVAIQNQEEIAYLNKVLPFNRAYYWIGIRKTDGFWTWVGTKKPLVPEAANWATNEPNNKGSGEDCVEIYIKRNKDTAKWNDEKCSKKKAAACYLASCSKTSCREHAECVETIGDYICQCDPGFTGPRCDEAVTCDPLLTPANSNLTCADPLGKFSFRSSCNVTCDDGYNLRGSPTLTCLKEGNWSAPTPMCEVVKCDPLKPTPHDSLQCHHPVEEFAYGSTCWLTCDLGFVRNGTNSSQCTKQGNWSHIPPVCHAIQCPPLSTAPVNGSMSCIHPLSSNSYNSSCEFKCEEGFVLRGADSTYCDHTGQWTDKTPICTAVTCDPLLTPANSNLTCADPLGKFSFRSSCNVTCDDGYNLRGSPTLTCLKEGNWSAPTPMCEVVKCDPLKPTPHDSLQCHHPVEEFAYGSTCWLTCDFGFVRNGTNSTQCTKQGNWSHIPPVCHAIQCPPLSTAPVNGSMSCIHPLSSNSYNSSCEFKCEEGFVLRGADSTHCDHTGQWTDKTPICTAVTCDPLLTPANSNLTCADPLGKFSFRSSCNVTCDDGYNLRGSPTLTCLKEGNWSAPKPMCEVVKCDPLKPTPHDSLQCHHPVEEFAYGSTCWLKCDFGFVRNDTNSTQCTKQGNWSHIPPVCHAIQCPPLSTAPVNGSMSCIHPLSSNSYNSSCEFKCEEGFVLRGADSTHCDHTGHWTDKTPICTAVTCDPLLTPANSNLTCADPLGKFSFRSSCNVTCDDGYNLRGSPTLTCLKEGNWSAPTPMCEVVKCDPLKPTPHDSLQCHHPVEEFAYGSTCWLKCDFGFVRNGTNSTQCTKQGNWSHIPPVCHAIQCPPLSTAPVNGSMSCIHPLSSNSYNSSCEFKCEEGFVLRGADSTHCDHTGHWTDKTPICTVIRCDALESVQHGSVHCQDPIEEFSYGSQCWFECQSGFTLNGSNVTHCTLQGKWNREFPVCQAQQCRSLTDPSHGIITCTHPHGQFSFGTVCEVNCQAGFKLHGTPQLECLEMGKWTDTPPLCLAQECPLLSAPENGWMNCSHPHSLFSYESQCFLGCETGFEITGHPGMQCSASGNWSQEMPSCAAVQCEPLLLTRPPHSMNCSHPHGNFSFGSQCVFWCAKNHELNGTSQLFCTSTGHWTSSPPNCVVMEMSLSTGLLINAVIGAVSSAGLLLLGGLMFLLTRQLTKKALYNVNEHSVEGDLNLAFELN